MDNKVCAGLLVVTFAGGYGLARFIKPIPSEVITTETKKEQIKQDVKKDVKNNVDTQTTTTVKKPDGTITVVVTKVIDKTETKVDDKTEIKLQESKVTDVIYKPGYSVGIKYLLPTTSITEVISSVTAPSISNIQIEIGKRLFDTNFFIVGGVNLGLKNVSLGVTWEL
jgi:hypothetical protein